MAQQPSGPDPFFTSITPADQAVLVGKKPDIGAEFSGPTTPDSLFVALDQTDVTQLVKRTETGFRYTPILALLPGSHTLRIVVADQNGARHERVVPFTSRHTQAFEEASAKNDLSAIYQYAAVKPDVATAGGSSQATIPRSKIEGNLKTDAKVKEQAWEFALTSNARYFDQSAPAASPLDKGVNIANWLATGTYTREQLKTKLSLGDVQVTETPYTISGLSRKGTVFDAEYDVASLHLFSAWTGQKFGLDGGVGIGDYRDDYLVGGSAGINLFDKRLELKAVYASGTDRSANALQADTSTQTPLQNTLGTTTTPGHKRGDVVGLLVTSDFFQSRFQTDLEGDVSRYDPDTTDEFGRKTDYAQRARAFGAIDWYSYEGVYEYFGPNYAVIGNEGLAKDKRGVSLRNGFNFGWHTLNLMASRYNDNVRGNDLFPRIVNYQVTADYALSWIPTLPMGVNYQKTIQDSTREPAGTTPVDLQSDTISGRVTYTAGKFTVGYYPSYSIMDDKSPADNDTTTLTNTLASSYAMPAFTIAPSLSWSRSTVHPTDVRTDTLTGTLDLRTTFFHDRASFATGGSYSIVRADNGSNNTRTLNLTATLGYNLVDFVKGFLEPNISLKASYLKNTDRVNTSGGKDEFLLYLVFTANLPVSF